MAFGAFYSLLPIRYSLVAVALVAATGAALAQTWPQRPVKVLVPFAAGGNIDVMGRLAALLGIPLGSHNDFVYRGITFCADDFHASSTINVISYSLPD
jgi:hypothetical protein